MFDEVETKSIEFSQEDAKTIINVFALSILANKKVAFLYEEELISMEIIMQKIKRIFYPEEFNKTLH